MTDPIAQGIAPADARPRKPWPLWAKVLAYLVLIAVASFSIWFIDQGAMREQFR
jgi:hypothetical protein